MPEVILIAVVTPVPGAEAEVERAFSALLAPTHGEDGCLLYALHRVEGRPGQLMFIEKWASREALDAHSASAHIARVGEQTAGLLSGPVELTFLEPLPGGDPELGLL